MELGKKFTRRVLGREVKYSSLKHKQSNIKFALNEAIKAYDLETVIAIAKEGLLPLNEDSLTYEQMFPGSEEIFKIMEQEGISYYAAKAKVDAKIDEELFGPGEVDDEPGDKEPEGTGKNSEPEQKTEAKNNEGASEDEPGTEKSVQEAEGQTAKVTKRKRRK